MFLINNLMFLLLDTMVHILYNDLKFKKVQFKEATSLKVNVFSKIFMRNIKQKFKKKHEISPGPYALPSQYLFCFC